MDAAMPTDLLPDGDSEHTVNRRSFLAGTGLAAAGLTTLADPQDVLGSANNAALDSGTNVILIIPDGQGRSQPTLARYLNAYEEDPDAFPTNATPDNDTLNYDFFEERGAITTMPADLTRSSWEDYAGNELEGPPQTVTDSAAAGTAMHTGVKTYNGAVGGVVDADFENGGFPRFRPVKTVLERAREAGYATGMVTTTELTHATPATTAAHVPDRGMQPEIARQYLEGPPWAGGQFSNPEQEIWVDVMMGGQKRDFTEAGVLELADWKGYEIVETERELNRVNEAPLLGLFTEESHMPYVLNRDDKHPSLVDMATKAVELLEDASDKGFFLMVEAGRIDHAGHGNDPAIAQEQQEADRVAGALLELVNRGQIENDTLIIIAGDHETGGTHIGRNAYDVNMDVIAEMDRTGGSIAGLVEDGMDPATAVTNHTGIDSLTQSEINRIEQDPGEVVAVINERANIGWGSHSHAGRAVPVWADGPNAAELAGTNDNTQIARAIAETMGL